MRDNKSNRIIGIDEQKSIALKILKFLSDYCKENGLRLFLAYGTLIGCIRHKGFIPWDDDIDVWMPREDYDILLKGFPNHPYYKLVCYGNSKTYNKIFATLNDTRTYKEEYSIRRKFRDDLCINVDIFPLDRIPDDLEEREKFFRQTELMGKKLQCLTWKYGKGKTFKSTILKNLGILYMRTKEYLGLITLQDFLSSFENLITKYNSQETKGFTTIGTRHFFPCESFKKLKIGTFESEKFIIPGGYDELLRNQYGDYMSLPPEEERKPHHNSYCYWRDNTKG